MSKQFELGQHVYVTSDDVAGEWEIGVITEVLLDVQAYRVFVYRDGDQWNYHETEIKELK